MVFQCLLWGAVSHHIPLYQNTDVQVSGASPQPVLGQGPPSPLCLLSQALAT